MGSLFQYLTTLSEKNFFLIAKLKNPLVQLKSITSHPITVTWEKRLNPTLLQRGLESYIERESLP